MITQQDEIPQLDPQALERFLKSSYDAELGWAPKPGLKSTESVGSLGALSGHTKRTSYAIAENGARVNPGHEHLPATISAYGDSYVFARQVNDDETWEWHLSELTGTNVLNFGVGNYGVDQALLRMEREHPRNRTDVVILGAVPETIVRILSVWKHYSEYGNVFATKPRFRVAGNGIELVHNAMSEPGCFDRLSEFVDEFRANDYFYDAKFSRMKLSFPYLASVMRHPVRHVDMITSLILRKLLLNVFGKHFERPWEIVLRDNQRYAMELHDDEDAIELLTRILRRFADAGAKESFTPIFLLMPYESDLVDLRLRGRKYYQRLIERASEVVRTIDASDALATCSGPLYTNAFYGSHLNARGNRIVAEFVHQSLSGT